MFYIGDKHSVYVEVLRCADPPRKVSYQQLSITSTVSEINSKWAQNLTGHLIPLSNTHPISEVLRPLKVPVLTDCPSHQDWYQDEDDDGALVELY